MKKIVLMCLLGFSSYAFAQTDEQIVYFNQRMAKVESTVPLTPQKKKQVLTAFKNLCKTSNDKPNYLLYRIALSSVFKNDTSMLYSMFKYEIDPAVTIKFNQYRDEYKTKFNLTDNQLNTASGIIYQQARQSQLLNYIYPDSLKQLNVVKKMILDKHKMLMEQLFVVQDNEKHALEYCDKRLDALRSNKLVDNHKQLQIKSQFAKLSKLTPNKSSYFIFNMAVTSIIRDTTLLYSIFKDDLDSLIQDRYLTFSQNCKSKYKLTNDQLKTISDLLYQQAKEFEISNFMSKQCVKSKKTIMDEYKDKIMLALAGQGVETILSNYCTALKYSKKLKLNTAQIKRLSQIGWNFYRDSLTNRDDLNTKKLEHSRIKEVLNKNQYETYLSIKVLHSAQLQADKAWNEMKQLQIVAEMDSALTQQQLLPYFTERMKIQEKFSVIPNSQKEMDTQLAALKANRPNVMKKCDAEKKRIQKSTEQNINALKW